MIARQRLTLSKPGTQASSSVVGPKTLQSGNGICTKSMEENKYIPTNDKIYQIYTGLFVKIYCIQYELLIVLI